jgi:signal transduction histidine kinase
MVAGVAHELNTPIGSSLTIATTLRSKAISFAAKVTGNSVKKSDLTEFSDSTKEATELLEQILWRTSDLVKSFKQVAADQVTDARRSFDLATSSEQIISTLKAFHKGTKIEILSDIPDGIVLDGYPGALGQVLTNLVNNAVFHGFDEGGEGEVKVSLGLVRPATIDILVSDNGRGMTEEVVKRAFEPFFTTRMGTGGTGLGLTIVRNIVTGTLGGKISLKSKPGQGTNVVLTIPRIAPARDTQEGHTHGR